MPEVTGVSPNEGPVQGGQRVVLRGSYLGECREDIVQVSVAGVDCTSSLEYFSPCTPSLVRLTPSNPMCPSLCSQTSSGDSSSCGSRQWTCCG